MRQASNDDARQESDGEATLTKGAANRCEILWSVLASQRLWNEQSVSIFVFFGLLQLTCSVDKAQRWMELSRILGDNPGPAEFRRALRQF